MRRKALRAKRRIVLVNMIENRILYEDNHIIIYNKRPGEIVQGDKTGDEPLVETLKQFIKHRDAKPGAVFLGVVHRLDRPVGGVVIFAKTSKALSRLNEMLRLGQIHKTYWALTRGVPPQQQGELTHFITSVERINKSTAHLGPKPGAKEARLRYNLLAQGENFNLLEINLLTGRKHQIRAQLSAIGCPIRGDLKYGDKRSNPDGSISLLARHIDFEHPVKHIPISITAPVPDERLWLELAHAAKQFQTPSTND